MKESRYVKLAKTMLDVLMTVKMPLYVYRKSNFIYTEWQHLILLTVSHYEEKSYRRLVELLYEGFYLRMYLQKVQYYATLQKFAARLDGSTLQNIFSFIILNKIRKLFLGIDVSGFRTSNALSCYTDRTGIRKKYINLSIGAELRE